MIKSVFLIVLMFLVSFYIMTCFLVSAIRDLKCKKWNYATLRFPVRKFFHKKKCEVIKCIVLTSSYEYRLYEYDVKKRKFENDDVFMWKYLDEPKEMKKRNGK